MFPPQLSDSVDVDLGELLAVAIERLVSFATDFLENEHFLGLGVVIDDGSLYHCALNIGGSDLDRTIFVDEQNLVERNSLSVLRLQAVHEDLHASFYFKLLTCNVYDCVHKTKLIKVWNRKRLPSGQLFAIA